MTEKQIAKNRTLCAIGAFVVVVSLLLILECFIGNISRVDGNSMYPTLHDGDVLIETQLVTPQVGDIVSFSSDIVENDNGRFVKRIIAQEGDHLVICDSRVYINDTLLNETYILESSFEGDIDIVIPKGTCFVMGDNRNDSLDSRDFGVINLDDITGIVLDFCIREGEDRYEDDINN